MDNIVIYVDHPAANVDALSDDLQKIVKILDVFDSVQTEVHAKPDHDSESKVIFDTWEKYR